MGRAGQQNRRRPGLRRRLAGWLDPEVRAAPMTAPPSAPPPMPPPRPRPGPDRSSAWAQLCDHTALRILNQVEVIRPLLDAGYDAEPDPTRLHLLYGIDQAVSLIRRRAENLQIQAGRKPADLDGTRTYSVVDLIRVAMAAIEAYPRVRIGPTPELGVAEFVTRDAGRLLAELLDNATRYSPPEATVTVSAHVTDRAGVLLRIEDAGIGLNPSMLAAANKRLAGELPPVPDTSGTHVGLSVVHRMASRHGIRVELYQRQPAGTITAVLLPAELLCEAPPDPFDTEPRRPARGMRADGARLTLARPQPHPAPPQAPEPDPAADTTTSGLPVRRPGSARPPAPAEIPAEAGPELVGPVDPNGPDEPAGVPGQVPVGTASSWADDVAAFTAATGRAHSEGE